MIICTWSLISYKRLYYGYAQWLRMDGSEMMHDLIDGRANQKIEFVWTRFSPFIFIAPFLIFYFFLYFLLFKIFCILLFLIFWYFLYVDNWYALNPYAVVMKKGPNQFDSNFPFFSQCGWLCGFSFHTKSPNWNALGLTLWLWLLHIRCWYSFKWSNSLWWHSCNISTSCSLHSHCSASGIRPLSETCKEGISTSTRNSDSDP